MDQNTGRDDAAGGQPPADPASNQAAGWNQTEQPAPGAVPEATAESTAWSADAAYQQPPTPQAYVAPEPQSATYADPAAAAPAGQQYAQPGYDQQAYQQQYAQPGYDQQAYQQQQYAQPGYDQQAYQQQYAQPGYDQQAYQQQYAQPGYDQQAYQQQYAQPGYDQQAYQQQQYAQPGYDQQAYQQQQYAQPGYPAQQPYPGQPYAQPGQWPGQEQYWEQGETGYGRSFLAVLSGFVLLTWGLMFGIGGGLVLYLGKLTEITQDLTLSAEVQQAVTDFDEQSTAIGAILLILGLVQIIGAVGIWSHRGWGRAFGIVLGLLGTLWGLGILIAAVGFEAYDVGFDVAIEGEESSTAAGLIVLATYLIVLIAMLVGRRHFRKKGVA